MRTGTPGALESRGGGLAEGYEEITFDQVGEGLERLKHNQVLGRLVARFGN